MHFNRRGREGDAENAKMDIKSLDRLCAFDTWWQSAFPNGRRKNINAF